MFSSDAPPGMIWRETLGDDGVTSIYCSGAAPATPLANIGKAFVAFGVVLALFIARTFGLAAAGPWFMPLTVLAIGGVLAFARRPGGPSTLTIAVGPREVRFSRGFWLNPLKLAPSSVRDMFVGSVETPYNVTTSSAFGAARNDQGSELFVRVVLVDQSGEKRVVACFGEEPCARFFAQRMTTLIGEASRAPVPSQGPFR